MPGKLDRTATPGVFRSSRSFFVRDRRNGGRWRRFPTYDEALAFRVEIGPPLERPESPPAPPRPSRRPPAGAPSYTVHGWVYFVAPVGGGPVKIGFTADTPAARLGALQVGSPVPLEVVASRRGTRLDEHRLHHRFREQRMHGEWFRPCAELLTEIERTPHVAEDQEEIADA